MRVSVQYRHKEYGTGSNANAYTVRVVPAFYRAPFQTASTAQGEKHWCKRLDFDFKFDEPADGISESPDGTTAEVKGAKLSLSYAEARKLAKAITLVLDTHEIAESAEPIELKINE